MGQSSVIFAFAATALVAVMLFAMQRSNSEADLDLAVYHNTALAREASMTGVNMTVRRLVDDHENWFTNTASYGYPATAYNGASFNVAVTSTHPDTVALVSIGTQHSVPHRIEAVFAKGLISGDLNEAFKYAIITDEDLTLNGSVKIKTTDNISNANIHANGDLTSNGLKVDVDGYATFGPDGSGTVNPERAIDDIFDPNTDTNGDSSNVFLDKEINIPVLDPSLYSTSPPADLVVNGDTTLFNIDQTWLNTNGYAEDVGTIDHPFLLYVGGNLNSSGTTVINGIYFQAIVQGTITVQGDIVANSLAVPANNAPQAEWDAWTAANLDANGNTMLGLYSNGNITVGGGFSITAQLFSNNTVTLNGGGGNKTNILGGIVSSTLNIAANGNVAITYTEVATVGVIEEFTSDTPEGVRLVDWAEF